MSESNNSKSVHDGVDSDARKGVAKGKPGRPSRAPADAKAATAFNFVQDDAADDYQDDDGSGKRKAAAKPAQKIRKPKTNGSDVPASPTAAAVSSLSDKDNTQLFAATADLISGGLAIPTPTRMHVRPPHHNNTSLTRRKWTEEEDNQLMELVRVHGSTGGAWARYIGPALNRTVSSCTQHWTTVVYPRMLASTGPAAALLCGLSETELEEVMGEAVTGISSGSGTPGRQVVHWTEKEDEALLEAVKIHGLQWEVVAEYVNSTVRNEDCTRSSGACQVRWSAVIRPRMTAAGNPVADGSSASAPNPALGSRWTEEESARLDKLVEKYGASNVAWIQIAAELNCNTATGEITGPVRTINACQLHHAIRKRKALKREQTNRNLALLAQFDAGQTIDTIAFPPSSFALEEHGNPTVGMMKRWSPEEDVILTKLVRQSLGKNAISWISIASVLGNQRTANACQLHWNWMLRKAKRLEIPLPDGYLPTDIEPEDLPPAHTLGDLRPLPAHNESSGLRYNKWHPDDEALLRDLVSKYGNIDEENGKSSVSNWKYIAQLMCSQSHHCTERTANSCQLHWAIMKKSRNSNRKMGEMDKSDKVFRTDEYVCV